MWAMAKHATLMEMDGNLMVVLMTNAEQFGEIHVNRGIESRAPPAQKISAQLLTLAERSTDQLAALAVAPCLFCAVAGRDSLWKLGRRQYPAWDLQERGSFGSQLSS